MSRHSLDLLLSGHRLAAPSRNMQMRLDRSVEVLVTVFCDCDTDHPGERNPCKYNTLEAAAQRGRRKIPGNRDGNLGFGTAHVPFSS